MGKAKPRRHTRSAATLTAPLLPRIEGDLQVSVALLPEQFFTPPQESHVNWTGERLLMLAVLQEAINAYLQYASAKTHRGKRLFAETYRWFWSQEREYLYSFESICLHLHLDPDYLRRGLRSIRQSGARSHPSRGATQPSTTPGSARLALAA